MNFELIKTFTVLYIEDEKVLREDVTQNIAPFVKKVIVGVDGRDGLKIFKQNQEDIDLIITDILMPHMNGIEMIDNIRKLDPDVPVIYTTAFNDAEYMLQTISQSVTAYILKPIDIELLLHAIEKASIGIENERLKLSLAQMNQSLEQKVHEKTKELQQKNEELYTRLFTDELTSLKNRKAFFKDIQLLQNPIVLIIDIDSFKTINDLYGEYIGNTVLVSVAHLLKNIQKENECNIYRTGSDEFSLLKDGEFHEEKCLQTLKSINRLIKDNPVYSTKFDIKIRISVTIGASFEKTDTFAKADMALKKAKADKVEYLIYGNNCNMENEYKNDIKWTSIIEKSLKNNTVVPFYQPIVDRDGNVLKYESLMRIIEGDVVHVPFYFLDIAKKVKLYANLEKTVIMKAFKKVKETNITVSINLSIEDILNVDFVNFITKELVKNNIASLIVFEILESESIEDYGKVSSFIAHVKELGSKIALDDFGSGYSNFAYLLKLQPDYIKLDGSFIKNIDTDENSYLIAKTIIDFAHVLGIKTIAEFVHSKEVFDVVNSLGVDEFQGYYFSQPVQDF